MTTSIDPQRLKLSDDGLSGALVGFQCLDCGVRVFGPATFCQSCTSENLAPVEFGQAGTLFSYTVVRVPPSGWTGQVPYVLGEVELPEGPHVLAEVVDADLSSLKVGTSMELAVASVPEHPKGDGVAVYKWRPAGVSQSSESGGIPI